MKSPRSTLNLLPEDDPLGHDETQLARMEKLQAWHRYMEHLQATLEPPRGDLSPPPLAAGHHKPAIDC